MQERMAVNLNMALNEVESAGVSNTISNAERTAEVIIVNHAGLKRSIKYCKKNLSSKKWLDLDLMNEALEILEDGDSTYLLLIKDVITGDITRAFAADSDEINLILKDSGFGLEATSSRTLH